MSCTAGPPHSATLDATARTVKVLKFGFDRSRIGEWIWLAVSYFEAARHLAKEKADDSRQHRLASPIIYCIRHGIELLLKAVILASDEKVELTHDNHFLFEKVRRALKEADGDSVAHAARALKVSEAEIRQYLDALSWKVEEITKSV